MRKHVSPRAFARVKTIQSKRSWAGGGHLPRLPPRFEADIGGPFLLEGTLLVEAVLGGRTF